MSFPVRLTARLGLLAGLLGLIVAVPVIETAIAPLPAEARAGGSYGGSRSSSSGFSRSSSGWSSSRSSSSGRYSSSSGGDADGVLAFCVFVLLAIFGGVFLAGAWGGEDSRGRNRQAKGKQPDRAQKRLEDLIAEAAAQDEVWREEAVLQHARDVFETVQRAWVARNQDLARDVMTPEMYDRHKAQTDAMLARGEVNVLNQLEILTTRVIHMVDRTDDTKDKVWVQIMARAEDYLMSEQTGKVLKGVKGEVHTFKEIWKFRRDGRTWKLDKIEPNGEASLPHSYRDEAPAAVA